MPERRDPANGNGDLGARVGRKARRKQRARAARQHSIWFGMGMFGLVGWSVTIPTLLGTAIGLWLDCRWQGEASWTLTLLLVGVILGCLNAWYWVRQESNRD